METNNIKIYYRYPCTTSIEFLVIYFKTPQPLYYKNPETTNVEFYEIDFDTTTSYYATRYYGTPKTTDGKII
jgi:hypothetical protein